MTGAKLVGLLTAALALACGDSDEERFASLLVPNLEGGGQGGSASAFTGVGGSGGRGGSAGLGGSGGGGNRTLSSYDDCTPDTEQVITLPAQYGRRSTGLYVCPGQTLTIRATGSWCWGGGSDCSGPTGTPGRPLSSELPVLHTGSRFGTVVGAVGDWSFEVGALLNAADIQDEGDLELGMNDRLGFYDDNSGYLTVSVSVRSRR